MLVLPGIQSPVEAPHLHPHWSFLGKSDQALSSSDASKTPWCSGGRQEGKPNALTSHSGPFRSGSASFSPPCLTLQHWYCGQSHFPCLTCFISQLSWPSFLLNFRLTSLISCVHIIACLSLWRFIVYPSGSTLLISGALFCLTLFLFPQSRWLPPPFPPCLLCPSPTLQIPSKIFSLGPCPNSPLSNPMLV